MTLVWTKCFYVMTVTLRPSWSRMFVLRNASVRDHDQGSVDQFARETTLLHPFEQYELARDILSDSEMSPWPDNEKSALILFGLNPSTRPEPHVQEERDLGLSDVDNLQCAMVTSWPSCSRMYRKG